MIDPTLVAATDWGSVCRFLSVRRGALLRRVIQPFITVQRDVMRSVSLLLAFRADERAAAFGLQSLLSIAVLMPSAGGFANAGHRFVFFKIPEKVTMASVAGTAMV
jgi:hypothetical protein